MMYAIETNLLDGGVPWKLRERCRGSYLRSAAVDGSCFTKSVCSRSCISRATWEESLEAYRRQVCESAVFCVRSRRKNEAVTSCKTIVMVLR